MAVSFSSLMRGGTAFDFEIDMRPPGIVVQMQFTAIAHQMGSFREPLEDSVRQVAIPAIGRNFDLEGPGWEPLASGTVAHRGGEAHPILDRTGRLRRTAEQLNMWEYTKETAFFSTEQLYARVPYGEFHQTGTWKMPQREFLFMEESDVDAIEMQFAEWIQGILVTHGFKPGVALGLG